MEDFKHLAIDAQSQHLTGYLVVIRYSVLLYLQAGSGVKWKKVSRGILLSARVLLTPRVEKQRVVLCVGQHCLARG